MVYATDYPWTELYGDARPPTYNEKTLGLAQPRAAKGEADPMAASGMAGVSRGKEGGARANVGVSFSRQTTPASQAKPAVVLPDAVQLSRSAGTCVVPGEGV